MNRIYCIYHQPATFTRRSAFAPFAEAVGGIPLTYDVAWERLQAVSWTAGYWLRQWGNRYYGSQWNALVPLTDERRLAHAIRPGGPCVAHFLWGEFASPANPRLFRRRGASLVGTFHCSARRQPAVLGRMTAFMSYDRLVTVSRTQVPFFVEKGYPADRIRVIPLGLDSAYFRPENARRRDADAVLRGVLVGRTERDHEFLAAVLRTLPPGVLEMSLCTDPEYHRTYRGIDGVRILDRLSDDDLVRLYQSADLMVMPMLDCTANDAMLESMACGTPVMTNRVGGVSEYVDPVCNVVLDGKNVDEWVERIVDLSKNRARLAALRPAVRAWAEQFSWDRIAEQYRELYRDVLAENRAAVLA